MNLIMNLIIQWLSGLFVIFGWSLLTLGIIFLFYFMAMVILSNNFHHQNFSPDGVLDCIMLPIIGIFLFLLTYIIVQSIIVLPFLVQGITISNSNTYPFSLLLTVIICTSVTWFRNNKNYEKQLEKKSKSEQSE